MPRLEKRLEDVRRDRNTRQDTSGDKFVMVIEGQELRDRGIAGELLLRRAERLDYMQGPEIVLKGATIYIARVTDTAPGTIHSVEHVD